MSNQDIQLDGRRIRLRKLGWVRLEERLRWRGRVKTVRVSCEASRWYVALGVEWDRRRGELRRVRKCPWTGVSVAGFGPRRRRGLSARGIPRRVADASKSRLLARISVKAAEAGGQVIVVPRHCAGMRICSACGDRTERIRAGDTGLAACRWTCERCGTENDRDINVARNLDPAFWLDPVDAASWAKREARLRATPYAGAPPHSVDGGGSPGVAPVQAGTRMTNRPGGAAAHRDGIGVRQCIGCGVRRLDLAGRTAGADDDTV